MHIYLSLNNLISCTFFMLFAENMDYSLQEMRAALANPRSGFYVHAVKEKDRPIYRSPIYAIWRRIYNHEDKIVQNFFVCGICRLMEKLDLSTCGNSKLQRHTCYANHVAAQHPENHENPEPAQPVFAQFRSGPDIHLLARVFAEFSRHCSKGENRDGLPLTSYNIQRILPDDWSEENWEKFLRQANYMMAVNTRTCPLPTNKNAAKATGKSYSYAFLKIFNRKLLLCSQKSCIRFVFD